MVERREPVALAVAPAAPAREVVHEPARTTQSVRRRHPLASALLIALAFGVIGFVPAILTGSTLIVRGVRLPAPLISNPRLQQWLPTPPAPTSAPDLALPRNAWIASEISVRAAPGGQQIAVLEPGFPVRLLARQTDGRAMWLRIQWAGPTPTTGGTGWVRDGAAVSFGGGSRPIGDLGALSATLNAVIAPLGAAFSASLFYPDVGQLYSIHAATPVALGGGFRALVLSAYLASLEAHSGGLKNGIAVTGVAAGDSSAISGAYTQLGGAAGLSTYLTRIAVTGAQPGATWQASLATTTTLTQLYAALAAGQTLNAADRATVLGQTPKGNPPDAAAAVAAVKAGSSGSVVAGLAQTASGWTLSVFGIAAPQGAPRTIFAIVLRDAPSAQAAAQSLAAFFQALNAQVGPS